VRYAGFWRRLIAGLIDFVVLSPITFLTVAMDGHSLVAAVLVTLFGQAGYYAYILPLTRWFGGTLGKLAVGVRVQPVGGGPLTWRHVLRRSGVDLLASSLIGSGTLIGLSRVPFATYAAAAWPERAQLLEAAVPWATWVNGAYMVWLLSEFVVILTNRQRRALHDFIASTVVVVTRGQPTPAPSSAVGLPVS
jgi:uncharacterized RDD family membrane protein YckC